jgi:ATP-dependent Clp protease adapter protein ClpS
MSHAETITKPIIGLQEPPMFKIIYLNDSQTTMEFVVDTLISFFNYTTETAFKITEQKGIEVTVHARSNNFPLQIKLEPETV